MPSTPASRAKLARGASWSARTSRRSSVSIAPPRVGFQRPSPCVGPENHTRPGSRAPDEPPPVYNVTMTPDNQDVFVLIALPGRPENQQTVIDTVLSAGDPADVPGLRSVELFRSLDGTRVVNQMHWDSRQAYER